MLELEKILPILDDVIIYHADDFDIDDYKINNKKTYISNNIIYLDIDVLCSDYFILAKNKSPYIGLYIKNLFLTYNIKTKQLYLMHQKDKEICGFEFEKDWSISEGMDKMCELRNIKKKDFKHINIKLEEI